MVKKINIFIAIIFLCGSAYPQLCENNDSLIEFGNGVCEQLPSFDNRSIDDFIDSVMIYPVSAMKDNIHGIVYIRCDVDTSGCTINHCILKGLSDDLNKEAMRIAKLVRFDIPAMKREKPVIINYVIPVKFKFRIMNSKKP